MYELLIDIIGIPEDVIMECPELFNVFIGGMSCVLVVTIVYMFLWFFLSIFRGTK